MKRVSSKTIMAMFWVLAVFIGGLEAHLNSFSSWILLGGIAVLPLLVVMRRWNAPIQSMSESIQEALR